MCGEKPFVQAVNGGTQGSPPRVRGKDVIIRRLYPQYGITPACAGKSHQAGNRRRTRWDHPRVCGEKKRACPVYLRFLGSPPRVRGKEVANATLENSAGITPACAGKSLHPNAVQASAWDHPRVCGEKLMISSAKVLLLGSPPRVRGKGGRLHRSRLRRRITPACAGKRGNPNTGTYDSRDHPRVCGEKTKKIP